jgi:DNA-directed RNA polymerase subunit K/omega
MNREEDDDDEDDDEEEDDHYLQKFDQDIKRNIISEHHPELQAHNYDEVDVLSRVIRNEYGVIVDPMHRTMPFVSKYERARIIGERAKQINAGAKPFIEVDVSVLDGYVIALAEFKEKKIPFIVKRPLPNGGCEYWKLQDLEILD